LESPITNWSNVRRGLNVSTACATAGLGSGALPGATSSTCVSGPRTVAAQERSSWLKALRDPRALAIRSLDEERGALEARRLERLEPRRAT
jgi:hypothetical protein